jgi:hypothetical protein
MSAPYYRQKARECLREADAAIDEFAKQFWRQMAASWESLAEQTEQGLFRQSTVSGRPPK